MVASEPGWESPETHLRLREERHRQEPDTSSEEEEEERVPAEAAGPEEAPVPAAAAGPVAEGLPLEEAEEEPTPSIVEEGGEAEETVSGYRPTPYRVAAGRGRGFRHRSDEARRYRSLKSLLKKHRKQGTEIPESVLKEIEDIGSGLSPEERGEPPEVTVSYAGGGERPSVPPADLYDAPWRVAQRKELRELQRQAARRKSRYPALRGTARRRIALKKRAGISRTPVKQRLERPITGRALRLSDRVKDLAQKWLNSHHGERRRVALPGSVVGLKAALSGDPTEGVCCSRSGCKTLRQESANGITSAGRLLIL